MVGLWPADFRIVPKEALIIPFPTLLITPPITKIYFVFAIIKVSSVKFQITSIIVKTLFFCFYLKLVI